MSGAGPAQAVRQSRRLGSRDAGAVELLASDTRGQCRGAKADRAEQAIAIDPDYAQALAVNYHEAMRLAREAIRQRRDFVAAYRVFDSGSGYVGRDRFAKASLQELHRARSNISLDWIAGRVPVMRDERFSEAFQCARELCLEALRRAGLE
jgi:hypothetical protein